MVEYYRRPTEPPQIERQILCRSLVALMTSHLPNKITLRDPYTLHDPKCEVFRAVKRFKAAARKMVRDLSAGPVQIHDKRSIRIEVRFQHWASVEDLEYQWRVTLSYDTLTTNRVFTQCSGIDQALLSTFGVYRG